MRPQAGPQAGEPLTRLANQLSHNASDSCDAAGATCVPDACCITAQVHPNGTTTHARPSRQRLYTVVIVSGDHRRLTHTLPATAALPSYGP